MKTDRVNGHGNKATSDDEVRHARFLTLPQKEEGTRTCCASFTLMVLLLADATSPVFAGQPMAAMEMKKETAQATHRGMGKVVSVDRAKLRIKLAHEPVRSLGWSAMVMDFSVAKASLLDGVKRVTPCGLNWGKPARMTWYG